MHELLEQLDLLAEMLDHIRQELVTVLAAGPEFVYVERIIEVERVIEVERPAEPAMIETPCPRCGPSRPAGYDVLERRPDVDSRRSLAREALRELQPLPPARPRRLR
jgi:hypothetical protein